MAARTTDRITPDGIKFQRMLKELADKEVRIGFQHGKATEENGADVCDVAICAIDSTVPAMSMRTGWL